MNVIKCDWCGTETQSTVDWLKLTRNWPNAAEDAERGYVILGREELDFHSPECVIAYLAKEENER